MHTKFEVRDRDRDGIENKQKKTTVQSVNEKNESEEEGQPEQLGFYNPHLSGDILKIDLSVFVFF